MVSAFARPIIYEVITDPSQFIKELSGILPKVSKFNYSLQYLSPIMLFCMEQQYILHNFYLLGR
jgi:hypothetical protein